MTDADWRAGLPPLDLGPLRRLVVVAVHVEDAVRKAGGLIAGAAGRGVPVVVIAASGEGEWAGRAGVRRLTPDAAVRVLELPAGELAEHQDEIVAALTEAVQAGDTFVSPWSGDDDPDRNAVARAATAVALLRGALHLEVPSDAVDPGAMPAAARLDLVPEEAAAKRQALGLDVPASESSAAEVFLLSGAAQPVDFDALYADADDPWGFADRWYEQRKRALLLAALPRPRFGRVLEIGSSNGISTAAFDERADEVIGTDVAARAVEQATERLRNHPHARVELRRLPEQWPDDWAPFDLIVLSETGFYLAGDALPRLIDRCRAALTPAGVFAACHWRPHVLGLDRNGDEVHRVIRARIGARRIVEHVEDDFLMEVFQADPSTSVAQAEGLR